MVALEGGFVGGGEVRRHVLLLPTLLVVQQDGLQKYLEKVQRPDAEFVYLNLILNRIVPLQPEQSISGIISTLLFFHLNHVVERRVHGCIFLVLLCQFLNK